MLRNPYLLNYSRRYELYYTSNVFIDFNKHNLFEQKRNIYHFPPKFKHYILHKTVVPSIFSVHTKQNILNDIEVQCLVHIPRSQARLLL